MKSNLILTFIGIIFSIFSFGQDQMKYYRLVEEANNLYDKQEYLEAALKYSEAFHSVGDSGLMNDWYNAACSWALSGQPDSSFACLYKIAQKGKFKEYDFLLSDPDLTSVYPDPRWKELLELVRKNKAEAEANYNWKLIGILDTVNKADQKYRLIIDSVAKQYGFNSKELEEVRDMYLDTAKKIDSVNLEKVTRIIDEYGWLGPDIIGEFGNSTLFLVIQHADLDIQLKYLPVLKEAVKEGRAYPYHLAYLQDRTDLALGHKQTYGSQLDVDTATGELYVSPLIDPDNVDKRRAEVGLGPLALYLTEFNLTWDVEQYKKNLPRYEELEKKYFK